MPKLLEQRNRIKTCEPVTKDNEAQHEFRAAREQLEKAGKPTKSIAVLTCGGASAQYSHEHAAKSIGVCKVDKRFKLEMSSDGTVVDLVRAN